MRISFKGAYKPFFLVGIVLTLSLQGLAHAKTPGHVYQETTAIVANIEAIRKNQGVTAPPRKPGVQVAKTPLHAFTKGLELFDKVSRYEDSLGIAKASNLSLPSANVTPSDVLELMKDINNEMEKIKRHHGISYTPPKTEIVPSRTPSDVYEQIWNASFMMDGLVPPISPTFVYNNTIRITEALMAMSRKLNKSISQPELDMPTGKKPIDANIEGFKAMFKMIELEKKVGIPVLRVPSFPIGNVTPSDVYDTTNNLLAEITRLNVKLGLPAVKNRQPNDGKITPNNVVRQMMIIQSLIDQLAV